jgi:hypothetical protein
MQLHPSPMGIWAVLQQADKKFDDGMACIKVVLSFLS